MNQARINDMIVETIERIVKSGYENAYVMTVSIDCMFYEDDKDAGDLRIRIPDSVSGTGHDLVVDLYRISSVESVGKDVYNSCPFWRIRGKNCLWFASSSEDKYYLDAGFALVDCRETAVKIISSRFLNICGMPMSDDAMKFLDIKLSVAGVFP